MKCQEADATAMTEAQALLDEETPTEAYAEPVSNNLEGRVVRGPSPVPDRRLRFVIMGMAIATVIGAGVAMKSFSTKPASANVESDIMLNIKPPSELEDIVKECKVTMYQDKNFKGKATVLNFPMPVGGQTFDCMAKYETDSTLREYHPAVPVQSNLPLTCVVNPNLAIWKEVNSMKMSSGCKYVYLGDDDPVKNQDDASYYPQKDARNEKGEWEDDKFRPDIKDDIKFVTVAYTCTYRSRCVSASSGLPIP